MPIIVNSPYSGRPVKVRDQDVGRALRDEEGRIFYAVARSDGEGYYGAPTRKGSDKDEKRYFDMETKGEAARDTGAQRSFAQVHDATGKRRKGRPVLLVLIVIILAALGLAYYWFIVQGNPLPGGTSPTIPGIPDGAPAPTVPESPPLAPAALRMDRSTSAIALLDTLEPRPLMVPVPAKNASVPTQLNPNAHSSQQQRSPVNPQTAGSLPEVQDAAVQSRPFTSTASGLQYRIDRPGSGSAATAGSFVVIDYTAQLPSGQVIRGWDEGVAGMREGESRSLIIPPGLVHSLGGSSDSAMFPHTTLHCTIELRDVRPGIAWTIQQQGTSGGRVARPGDTVEMHYTAWVVGRDLPFDSSRDRGEPLTFTIGAGQVITGWDLGVAGMREGEIRALDIPSYLAYGKRGFGAVIPPNADLRYQLDLVRVVE